MSKIRFLNGNTLKLLAALFMLIDHAGLLLFPRIRLFRFIGRLSMPIFAFMISEGAKYTRNKTNYFLGIASLAFICQAVYYFYGNSLYMSILVTFSLSILIIYAMQNAKKALFQNDKSAKISSVWLFCFTLVFAYAFTHIFSVDYGFIGVMMPVFASIPDFKDIDAPQKVKAIDNLYVRILLMGILVFYLGLKSAPYQHFALLSLPLLMLYSNKRGKLKLKYFFYVFYPVHLLALEGISMLLRN